MKRNNFILLVIGTLVFSLSSCNTPNNNAENSSDSTSSHEYTSSDSTSSHEHTYSSRWNYDSTYHWHNSTCGHDITSDKEKHTFNDVVTPASYSEGGYTTHTCTICGYSYTDSQTDRLTYSITWKNWDGSVLNVSNCYEGEMPFYKGTPAKTKTDDYYYEFTGWSPAVVPAHSDATYTAQFSQQERTTFTVQYNSNGGNITPSSQTKTRGKTLVITSTKPSKEGHTFIGWNNIFEDTVYPSGGNFNLDKDVTLWAVWEDTCEHCNGTGIYSWTSTCSFCSGTGKRDQCNSCGSYSIKTVIINGIGSIKQCNNCNSTSISTKTCTWCNGKGSSSGSESCTYCNHTGHHGGDAPTTSSIEARKIILKIVSGFEYSLNKSTWQSSPVFDNLKPSTRYTFYQRRATSGNVPFGETSKPLSATTSSATLFYVTYILNGGTNDSRNPTQYYSNQSNKTLYNPTREHYTFANWTYNGTAVTQINASWASDIELVANWTAVGYSITYNLDGGTNNSANPSTHGIESGNISLAQPTKNGYTFIGWTGSNGNTPELDVTIPAGNTDNLTYNANWSLNTYTISYQMNGGINNPSNPETYTVLDDTIVLETPTRDHYDFKGWKDGNSAISRIYTFYAKDYTLSATWSAHNYSITYNLDGGTNNSANPSAHGIESGNISLAQPTKNGYTFIGWTGSNGNTPELDVTIPAGNTDNLTYNANWSLNTYTISYHLDGGVNHVKNPNSYTIEDTIELRNASKDYYSFEGWYKEAEFINKIETLHGEYGNLNLYAKFTPFTYSASYDANGGSLTFDKEIQIQLDYGDPTLSESYTIHQNESFNPYNVMKTFQKASNESSTGYYSFRGWYLDSEYVSLVSGNCVISENTVLYAKWSETPKYSNTIPTVIRNGLYSSASGAGTKTGPVIIEIPYNCTGSITLSWSIWGTKSKVTTPSGTYYEYGGGGVTAKDLTTGSTLFTQSGHANSSSDYSKTGTVDISALPGHVIQLSTSVSYPYSYINSSNLRVKSFTTNNNLANISLDKSTVNFDVLYDSTIQSPTAQRNGYDFAGWYDENGNSITETWEYTSDQTFHAEWSIHDYSILYVLNGGTNSSSNPSSYNLNDTILLNDPSRDGYSFAGWYTDPLFNNKIETINGANCCDYTLYAKWVPNSYTATLDYNGGQNCPTINFYSQGNIVKTVDLYKDSTLEYFAPETPNNNLIFAGWYTDSSFNELFSFTGVVNSDLNLYAKWIDVSNYQHSLLGNNVNVQINGNQYGYVAIASPVDQTITITSSSGLDLYGAVFDSNWNIVASCDDISDENLDFSMSITLQAGQVYYIGYKANQVSTTGECTIYISGNSVVESYIVGGYTDLTESVVVNYDSSFILPTPKKEGYIFVGWYDENGNQIDTSSWNYTGNITIYAHWIPAN